MVNRGVKLCRFGIPGQGFYSLHVDIPENELARIPVRGILTVIEGVATVGMVVNELKNLFVGLNWEWKVKQLNKKEFLINFPSEEVRSKISTCKSFDFDTCHIKASVVETGMTEEAIDELAIVWVKIFGIPKSARNEDAVKAIVELVGEFEALDNLSLRRDGPVRVRVACKDPRELHFVIHVYINKVGYKIRWEPEGFAPYENKNSSPPEDGDDDDKGDEGNEDMNVDEDFNNQSPMRGRQNKDNSSQMGGRGQLHTAPPAYKGKTYQQDSCRSLVKKMACKKLSLLECVDSGSKDLVLWEGEPEEVQEYQELELPLSGQFTLRGGDEEKMISTNDSQEKCDIPTLSDIERLREEEEFEEEDSFKEVSYKKRPKKRVEPVVTSRMSLRNREMATVPIPKRAELLTQKKNLECTGTSLNNPFAVFQLINLEELSNIAIAANISLGKNAVDVSSNIDTIKAKELVQAKLAELRWKQEKEKEVVVQQEDELIGVSLQEVPVNESLRNSSVEVVSPIVDEGNLEIDDAGSIEGVQPDKMSPVETLALSRRGGNKKPKKKMKILFWNVRGLGNSARRGLLKEMIKLRDIDIVGLQETKRENFSNRELNSFQGSKTFSWAWKTSRGASGGILLGVNTDKVELIRNHVGAYFLSCVIRHKFNQKT